MESFEARSFITDRNRLPRGSARAIDFELLTRAHDFALRAHSRRGLGKVGGSSSSGSRPAQGSSKIDGPVAAGGSGLAALVEGGCGTTEGPAESKHLPPVSFAIWYIRSWLSARSLATQQSIIKHD